MKQILLLLFTCCLLQGLRCVTVVSGTTDTGNAKILGMVYTRDGQPASGAEVTILPSDYLCNSPDDNVGVVLVTDDSGCFKVDSLQNGNYNIEVNNGNSAVMLNVAVNSEQSDTIDARLEAYGAFKGNAGAAENTVTRYLVIYGLNRVIKVSSEGDFFVGNLPRGTFDIKIVSFENDSWKPVEIDSVAVFPEDTLQIPLVGWEHKAQVTLNTSETGADVANDVVGFPVLLKLTELNFNFAEARGDGSDCRFYKNDTIPLPFHIEMWDSSLQKAYIWVRIDTVYGNNADQYFTMLWGNTNAVCLNDSGSVFDTSDGFLGCYHFDGNVNDATGNKFDGKDSGTVEIPDGVVGAARMFNGTSYIGLGKLPERSEGAISCWVRPGVIINSLSPVTYGIWGNYESDRQNYTLSFQGSGFYSGSGVSGKLISKAEDTTNGYYLSSESAVFEENVWYHIAWSWGENGNFLCVNGNAEMKISEYRPVHGNGKDEIGRSYYDSANISTGGPYYLFGALDEFRIDKVQRSESWIKLCYKNQLPNDVLVAINRL